MNTIRGTGIPWLDAKPFQFGVQRQLGYDSKTATEPSNTRSERDINGEVDVS